MTSPASPPLILKNVKKLLQPTKRNLKRKQAFKRTPASQRTKQNLTRIVRDLSPARQNLIWTTLNLRPTKQDLNWTTLDLKPRKQDSNPTTSALFFSPSGSATPTN